MSESKKDKAEVAAIFNSYHEEFMLTNHLCPEQQKAFNAIVDCRTSQLGGHINTCNQCAHKQQAYNSWHNRHCLPIAIGTSF